MPAAAPDLSLTEWVVLGILAEGPAHGFAVARALKRGTPLGEVWTVPRPLVYRAIGRLLDQGLLGEVGEEPGSPGPPRTVYKITTAGRKAAERWRAEPVSHLREVRSGFLVKALLRSRAGESLVPLVEAQQAAFVPVFGSLREALDRGEPEPVVAAWRYESAQAAARLLERLGGDTDGSRRE
ncbi:MAG: PadR family transcriptional regulator [Acidimicrobiia bacterium]